MSRNRVKEIEVILQPECFLWATGRGKIEELFRKLWPLHLLDRDQLRNSKVGPTETERQDSDPRDD